MIELMAGGSTMFFVHLCVGAVFTIGLLCFFIRPTPIRQIAGIKLMLQSVSLGLILTGWKRQDLYLAQSLVISALIVEAIVIGLALTMIIRMKKHEQAASQGKADLPEAPGGDGDG
ncbi:MAG: NADH-quinone oxidoreductase subunit K [Chloroflexota bacterium]|nr:NADH-quinone oxidoreductase subunit K [Chloroflexota bacterium]